MTLINIILPAHKELSSEQLALYRTLCQLKGELLSYFETIETYIGVVILAEKLQNGILDYVLLEQAHLSKSTTTRKITKAIDITTEAGYYELAQQLEYYKKVLWLRNFFAHSNFYVNHKDQLMLSKRSQDDESVQLFLNNTTLDFQSPVLDDSLLHWNGKTLIDIEEELQTQNNKFVALTHSYTSRLNIREIRYY